jgi:hypothetical protein
LKAAVSLQEAQDLMEIMQHSCESDLVGDAMLQYLNEGLLLADVHQDNVGKVRRKDEYSGDDLVQNVITDPGHMVPLDKRWLSVEVPSL